MLTWSASTPSSSPLSKVSKAQLTRSVPRLPNTHDVRTIAHDDECSTSSRSPPSFERPYSDTGRTASHSS